MRQLNPNLIASLAGKDLIAFGTGGLGKLLLPYLVREPTIRLLGVTNSKVSMEDAGIFLDTGLRIRSISTWARLMPDAVILLCVIEKNEDSARAACEAAGFHKFVEVPFNVIEMAQNLSFGGEWPTGHPMFHYMCMANDLHDTHVASFLEFKGCHHGKTVAVVGAGPSLDYYFQAEGIPHIGVNYTIFRKGLHLDYHFIWDYEKGKTEKLKDYDCIKFMGRNEWDAVECKIPEFIFEENHARRFFVGRPDVHMYTNIEHYPLFGYYSIIFPAIQFAMYTRPRKLLLIGCDCKSNGHFSTPFYGPEDEGQWNYWARQYLEGYKILKQFVDWNYPDMEIISINPVGLKGMFHDMYTESYLAAHPELDRARCEIFNPDKLEID